MNQFAYDDPKDNFDHPDKIPCDPDYPDNCLCQTQDLVITKTDPYPTPCQSYGKIQPYSKNPDTQILALLSRFGEDDGKPLSGFYRTVKNRTRKKV